MVSSIQSVAAPARPSAGPVVSIGTDHIGYIERRNFAYLTGCDFTVGEVRDGFEVLRKLWHRLSGRSYSRLLHSFAFPSGGNPSGFHYFNKILLRRQRWVVSFETTLPRYHELPWPLLRFALSRLAHPNCKAILAISECAANRFREDLLQNRARLSDQACHAIRAKLQTLHPPQALLCTVAEKLSTCDFEGTLRLVLVGNDFFRKGGLELLLAVEQLLITGRQIELTIAGRMTAGDYASRAGAAEVAQAREIISRHPGRIQALGEIANEQVLAVLKQSHILCLPTWGETYGFSVLEGQAAACPALTTDLRALPEINNDECGWVVPVPKLPGGDGAIATVQQRKVFHQNLVRGLVKAISEAHDSRDLLRSKARRSVERIKTFHCPRQHQQTLESIYRTAFS